MKRLLMLILAGAVTASAGEMQGQRMGAYVVYVNTPIHTTSFPAEASKTLHAGVKRALYRRAQLVVEERCAECVVIKPYLGIYDRGAKRGTELVVVVRHEIWHKGRLLASTQIRKGLKNRQALGKVMLDVVTLAAHDILSTWDEAFGPPID